MPHEVCKRRRPVVNLVGYRFRSKLETIIALRLLIAYGQSFQQIIAKHNGQNDFQEEKSIEFQKFTMNFND